jgi:hypothetical protein
MGHAFFPALDTGPVNDNASGLDNPAKDGDVLKFFFSQRPDLGGHGQANTGDVQIRRVVAGIDIGLSRANIFFPDDPIRNKIEFAKCPGPKFEKLITDGTMVFSDQEREEDTRQVDDHEQQKDKVYPPCVDF